MVSCEFDNCWIDQNINRCKGSFVLEANKLWETLRFRFSLKNGTRVHQLQDAITNCKQDGQYVLEYYGRMTKLWEEIQNLKTSRPCTCDAAADIEKEQEDSRVHKFLFGLDDARFSSIRSRVTDAEATRYKYIYFREREREESNGKRARQCDLFTVYTVIELVQTRVPFYFCR